MLVMGSYKDYHCNSIAACALKLEVVEGMHCVWGLNRRRFEPKCIIIENDLKMLKNDLKNAIIVGH